MEFTCCNLTGAIFNQVEFSAFGFINCTFYRAEFVNCDFRGVKARGGITAGIAQKKLRVSLYAYQ
ncbi:pentapeptide repeat-containing protein [Pectobacterium parmentieri]|uniref:pentapeptide repeat-containing protein n=1 Tax=Pectobacterium parmentieri TaxID=1905730 RepID=UPI0012F787DA